MASDSLNEVGKDLRRTKDEANYASKKVRPNRPSVERTRDIFDSTVDFEMKFDVSPKQKRVGLDLEFNKPPPLAGCRGVPCHMKCETFDGLAAGSHELGLSYDFLTGSLAVYVNGTTWSSTKWAEVSPTNGTVYVSGLTQTSNTVTICYARECSDYVCSSLAEFSIGQTRLVDLLGGELTYSGSSVPVPPLDYTPSSPQVYTYTNSHGANYRLVEKVALNGVGVSGGQLAPDDRDVNSPSTTHWGSRSTVIDGPQTATGYWRFEFPPTRLCAAVIGNDGGGLTGSTEITVDYQNGNWRGGSGSFDSVALVPLLPVVASEIRLHWTRTQSAPGLQFWGGIDFNFFMVFGADE